MSIKKISDMSFKEFADSVRKTETMSFKEFADSVRKTETYDKEIVRSEISNQIDAIMDRQKVTRAELARRLGKSRAYVTKVLQGNANFTIDSLVQIARALGCQYKPVLVTSNLWEQRQAISLSADAPIQPDSVSYPSDHYDPISSDN